MNDAQHKEMDPALDLWLDKAVPRYTSYPPAPNFSRNITGIDYLASLQDTPPSEPLSLYVHIPFCHELCLYCGCHTTVTRKQERVMAYMRCLQAEIAATSRHLPSKLVRHIHFGGGTPNILSPEMLDDLFSVLRRNFTFDVNAEIAMELDPRHVDEALVKSLSRNGVNRVSLGVQDFAEPVQRLINRIQPYQQVADVCVLLRQQGITRINFDLMYGLPLQTEASVQQTAQQVCSLMPQRIALFSYAHVPQLKRHQVALEVAGIPTMTDRLSMDRAARQVLYRAGYRAVGMDHFAQLGDELLAAAHNKCLHRNFQGYTTDTHKTLIAFGASAISQTRDGFYQNEADIEKYQAVVLSDQAGGAKIRGYRLSPDDKLRAAIIEQLMCHFTCDVAALCRQHRVQPDHLETSCHVLESYHARGLIDWANGIVTLRSPFPMAIRVVAQAFDATTPAAVASRVA